MKLGNVGIEGENNTAQDNISLLGLLHECEPLDGLETEMRELQECL